MYPGYFRKLNLYLFIIFFCCNSCNKADTELYFPDIEAIPIKTKIIAILGSSTAAGTGAKPHDSSWVNKLKYRSLTEGKDVNIINLAVSGYTTKKVLPSTFSAADTAKNIDKALTYRPDLIIISFPTNDIAHGYTDAQIINNYRAIIKVIKAANTPFIIMSTQPRDLPQVEARMRLAQFDEKLISSEGCPMVNVYQKLATPNYFINPVYSMGDGIHLNNKGHDIIFQSVFTDSLFRNAIFK